MNLQFSFQILNCLVSKGVKTFCIAPSSRNAPFVEVLSHSDMEVFYFFDERSMAFFAHGRSGRDHKPVAVITTSGTAVCELYPAVVESYYSSSSLVLITADRPSDYEGTAAPQCIEQTGMFSKYVSREWDLEAGQKEKFDLSYWDTSSSIHINVRFDEPLIDEEALYYQFLKSFRNNQYKAELDTDRKIQFVDKNISPHGNHFIKDFFNISTQPVIILSELLVSFKGSIESFLLNLNRPVYAEPLSQLRESSKLKKLILTEDMLNTALKNNLIDGVIRIGAIPVLRFWRDLNNLRYPVLSFSLSPFSGLKKRRSAFPLELLFNHPELFKPAKENLKIKALEKKPKGESAWIRWLSEKIPKKSHIFLGNSLPIREWDVWAVREDKKFVYSANRGANGIDGLISSFLGGCFPDRSNYLILGDLSTLYDLSSPWILDQLKKCSVYIVVINNFGGRIFQNKFQNFHFLNDHHLNFSHFAKMWSLNYKCLKKFSDNFLSVPSPAVIEIQIPQKS